MFWRPIYKVIDNSFFPATELLPTKNLYQCKNNPNNPHTIPSKVKVALKKMAMQQGLYKKVVIIRLKESENKK